jgi:hypothetical protein
MLLAIFTAVCINPCAGDSDVTHTFEFHKCSFVVYEYKKSTVITYVPELLNIYKFTTASYQLLKDSMFNHKKNIYAIEFAYYNTARAKIGEQVTEKYIYAVSTMYPRVNNAFALELNYEELPDCINNLSVKYIPIHAQKVSYPNEITFFSPEKYPSLEEFSTKQAEMSDRRKCFS